MEKICTECIPEINYTAEEMREYTKASEIR